MCVCVARLNRDVGTVSQGGREGDVSFPRWGCVCVCMSCSVVRWQQGKEKMIDVYQTVCTYITVGCASKRPCRLLWVRFVCLRV